MLGEEPVTLHDVTTTTDASEKEKVDGDFVFLYFCLQVSAVKSGVDNVKDVWEALGSHKENRYTWDMAQNDNLQMTGRCPRLRFDRLYYYQQNQQLVPIQFDLIGKERLACGRFMSDHWGIRCIFKVKRSANSASSSGT